LQRQSHVPLANLAIMCMPFGLLVSYYLCVDTPTLSGFPIF
jgi:hypothetical protein